LVERFSHNQRSEFKTYLDHFLYTVPTKPVNWRYFTFPSTSVGQEGVYQAYRYLYEKNEYYKSYYLKPDSIQISAENHQEVIDALVSEQRSVFREKHGLTEDHQVFFLAPGNTPEEVYFLISDQKVHGSFQRKYRNFPETKWSRQCQLCCGYQSIE
jgi:hypothetical protein